MATEVVPESHGRLCPGSVLWVADRARGSGCAAIHDGIRVVLLMELRSWRCLGSVGGTSTMEDSERHESTVDWRPD